MLEAAALPFPRGVTGTVQRPSGTSMIYSFGDAEATALSAQEYVW